MREIGKEYQNARGNREGKKQLGDLDIRVCRRKVLNWILTFLFFFK